MGCARTQAGRVALHPIEERRARQHARDPRADALVETAASVARLPIERQRRIDIGLAQRAPIGATRQARENPLRARGVFGRRRRAAHEQRAARRGLVADAGDLERPGDAHGPQPRQAAGEMHFLAVALRDLPHILPNDRTLAPRDRDVVWAGAQRDARLQPLVELRHHRDRIP